MKGYRFVKNATFKELEDFNLLNADPSLYQTVKNILAGPLYKTRTARPQTRTAQECFTKLTLKRLQDLSRLLWLLKTQDRTICFKLF